MNSVSIILPTYNSTTTLHECLESIKSQNYPSEKIEIIVVDGGSNDDTIEIASKFTEKIFINEDKVEERGRIIGIRESQNYIIGFIDADNILDSPEFLQRMLEPFDDHEIQASQPLFYSHREQDPLLVRYCGLIGGDDPIAVYLGYFDHFCYFSGKSIGIPVPQEDNGRFLKLDLGELDTTNKLPFGANGFFFRRHLLNLMDRSGYDIKKKLVSAAKSSDHAEVQKLLPALEGGEVDMVLSGMTMSGARNQKFAFVGPYFVSGKSFLAKYKKWASVKDASEVNSPNTTLAALKGSTSQVFVETLIPKAKLIATRDYDEAVDMVLQDKVDALIADYPICLVSVFRYPNENLVASVTPITYEPIGIAMPGNDPLLVNWVENFLNTLEGSGELRMLRNRWFFEGDWLKKLP